MTSARGDRPSRRSVLASGGLLLLAACTGSSPVRAPQLTADQRLARRVAAEIIVLSAAYAATIAAHPRTRRELAPLAAEHEAHLTALAALQPAPTATPSTSSSGSTSPSAAASPTAAASPSASSPPVAPSPAAARTALATAEEAAAARRRHQAGDAGPDLARLLASIAACEAVHAALVAP
jgi:hypothetical protein